MNPKKRNIFYYPIENRFPHTCRDGTLNRFIELKLLLSLSFKCNNELFDVSIFFKRFFDDIGLNENVRLSRFFALYKPLRKK
jgi:hypothetical protein